MPIDATSPPFGRTVAALGVGVALGNIPSADIARRLADEATGRAGRADGRSGGVARTPTDLRAVGSNNPGALNAGTQLGKGWGAAVLALDVAKGVAAAAIGRALAGPTVANLAATAAVAGHCHPVGDRTGGKGVATSIGQVIGTFPRYLPLDIAVAVGTAALPRWTQRTWVATATASAVWVTAAGVAWARGWSTGTDDPAPPGLPIAAALSSAIIARRFLATPLVDGRPVADGSDSGSTALEVVE